MVKKKIKINLKAQGIDKNTGNIGIGGNPSNDGKNTGNITIRSRKK